MRKEDFVILRNNNLVYLDSSATSQKPDVVIEAVKDYYEKSNANVHRGIYNLSEKATLAYEEAREVVAKFIGAKSEEVIFTSGTTQSLNMLASMLVNSLNIMKEDEIVLTEMEHHSNLVPWQMVAKKTGAVLRFIPVNDEGVLDMEMAREVITSKTKVVSAVHISNVLGTINPIKELSVLAHGVGAVMVVDAAQSVGHMEVDVKELGCDFLAFSGHKMCAPMGVGVLYGKKCLLLEMEPQNYGGGMVDEVSFESATWASHPERFEAGTPNISAALGLGDAIKYLQEVGVDNIEKHGQELGKYAKERLEGVQGLKVLGPKLRGSLVSFVVKGMHPHDIADELNKKNIAVRAGHHCVMPLHKKLGLSGSTRASFYLYNTMEDVDKLVDTLKEVVGEFNIGMVDALDRNEIISGDLSEDEEMAKENIIDHYQNPHNKRIIEGVMGYKENNPLCGDEITIFAKISGEIIEDVGFVGDGCAISQASISLLTDKVKGMRVDEVKKLSEEDIYGLLGIPISFGRKKCALLSLRALQGGLA